MHWVYVVLCEDGHIYVGETTHLYTRFFQHQTGRGGVNTSAHRPFKLIGLYSVGSNTSFSRYRGDFEKGVYDGRCSKFWGEDEDQFLAIENLITERYMFENRGRALCNVSGGKYITPSRCEKYKLGINSTTFVKDRPLCKCGYPCEIKMKKDESKLYFICPLPAWDNFYDGLELDEPCNFWEEFVEYRVTRDKWNLKIKDNYWTRSLPVWKHDNCIQCNQEYYDKFYSYGSQRAVCNPCFQLHYDELKAKYAHIRAPVNFNAIFPDW